MRVARRGPGHTPSPSPATIIRRTSSGLVLVAITFRPRPRPRDSGSIGSNPRGLPAHVKATKGSARSSSRLISSRPNIACSTPQNTDHSGSSSSRHSRSSSGRGSRQTPIPRPVARSRARMSMLLSTSMRTGVCG
ncbi:hypothetical protein IX57_00750 [Paracoccus sanguinis]|nr:hypothetical protein IX57_00750 [Paracoccus sanguinis]